MLHGSFSNRNEGQTGRRRIVTGRGRVALQEPRTGFWFFLPRKARKSRTSTTMVSAARSYLW